jgi:nucleoid-associated protein YgaU
MTATSIDRIIGPFLVAAALAAACGAAAVFGIAHLPREPHLETRTATDAPAVSPHASGHRDEASGALAQAEISTTAAGPAAPARSLDTDGSVPVFDVVRIEPTGDAVIAGRAAPGAVVELLRNGERHDRAVADQAGQFVMVPPRLPPGEYDLTLTSRQPDGKQASSKQRVAVALDALGSWAEVPFNVPQTVAASRPVLDRAGGAHQPSGGVAKQQVTTDRPQAPGYAATSTGGSPPAVDAPKMPTAVVSRGDSLWRISRATYGTGVRYAIIYQANRHQIRKPNLIYPGQIFVLPQKVR